MVEAPVVSTVMSELSPMVAPPVTVTHLTLPDASSFTTRMLQVPTICAVCVPNVIAQVPELQQASPVM
jgi:hypothetical protein